MKTKLELFVLTGFLLLSFGCKQGGKSNFALEIKLEKAEKAEVKLMQLGISQAVIVDSLLLDSAKSFNLTGNIQHPALFSLRIQGHEDIFLVIHPDDSFIVEIDNTNMPATYVVQGSSDSRLVNEILSQQKRVMDRITNLSIDYENSKLNPENFEQNKVKFDSIYDNLLLEHKQYTIEFIKTNPRSLACIFALYQNFGRKGQSLFNKFDDIEIFNVVDSNLTQLFPETEAVIALNRDVTEIKEQLKLKKFSEENIEAGRRAPEFEITTINGEKISLSSMKNAPVVYFFFAVWNEQSVQEALALNELLQKYSYRNVNLIGVSFDSSPEKLKAFIQENSISFPVACDYKYWESKYVSQFGVLAIPDILLLDSNHIVHSKNINTQELIQILTEWKKNNLF
jgi:peroxiredoxin